MFGGLFGFFNERIKSLNKALFDYMKMNDRAVEILTTEIAELRAEIEMIKSNTILKDNQ